MNMDNLSKKYACGEETLNALAKKYGTTVKKETVRGLFLQYGRQQVDTPWGEAWISSDLFIFSPRWTSDNPGAVVEWGQEVQDLARQYGTEAVPIVDDWKRRIARKARSYSEAIEILKAIGTRVPGGGPLIPGKAGSRFQPVHIQWEGLGRVYARNDGNVIVSQNAQSTPEGLQKQAKWLEQVADVIAEFER